MAISLGIFFLLLFGLPMLWRRGYRNLRNLSVAGMVFLSIVNISKLIHTKEEVWLLQDFGESLILHISPKEITLFTNNPKVDSTYLWSRLSDAYVNRKIQKQELPRLFKLGQQTYLQIDSTAVYPKEVPDSTIVILQQSSRINLDKLQELADNNNLTVIDTEVMIKAGFMSPKHSLKILGNGTLTSKLDVKAHAFSKSAEEAITNAGGTAVKI